MLDDVVAMVLISLCIRIAAIIYSVILARRFRDWRLSIMTMMLVSLCIRQAMMLQEESITTQHIANEVPALVASILAFPAMYFMGRAIQDRERAAAAALESELRFEELAHRITDVFWSTDWTHHKILYVSPGYREIFGREPNQLYANPLDWSNAIHPEDRQRVTDLFLSEAPTGGFDCKYRIVRPNGEVRWIRDRGFPITDERGVVQRIAGLAEDITERTLTEESLRQANAHLKMSITASNLGLWTWDVVTNEVHFLARWKAQLGYEDHEIADRFEEWETRLHPDDRQRAVKLAKDYIAKPISDYHNEFRLRHKNGTYRWIYVLGSFLPETDGSSRLMMGCHIDITDRKIAEEKLRVSEQRFHSMARISPVGLFRTLPDGRCVYVNEQWCSITGLGFEEAMGEGWVRALHPDDRDATLRAWQALETVPVHHEFRFRRADGKDVWVLGQAAPEVGPGGEVLGYVGSVTDITERKQAEERQRLLLSELDHRVKNNLAAVLSLAEQTIGASRSLDEFRGAFIGRVHAMVQSHAALARAHGEGVDLREAANLILAPFLHNNPTRIQIDGDGLMLPARASLPLALTLHELATNAAKYGALSVPGGHVHLAWRRTEAHVLFTWTEFGGPRVTPPASGGIGYELIRGLIGYEMHGKVDVDFATAGLVCNIDIPLEQTKA